MSYTIKIGRYELSVVSLHNGADGHFPSLTSFMVSVAAIVPQ